MTDIRVGATSSGHLNGPVSLAALEAISAEAPEFAQAFRRLDRVVRLVLGEVLARGDLDAATLSKLELSITRQAAQASALERRLGTLGADPGLLAETRELVTFLEEARTVASGRATEALYRLHADVPVETGEFSEVGRSSARKPGWWVLPALGAAGLLIWWLIRVV